jgi:hypothetical protein
VGRRRIVVAMVLAGAAIAFYLASGWRAARGAPLDRDGVRVLVASELAADGTLRAGRIAGTGDGAGATTSFRVVRDLMRASEWDVAPVVVVHHAPRLAPGVSMIGPVTHEGSAGLLLPDGASANETVLAHELSHVAILTRRTGRADGGVAPRVVAVIDEGVADFAASVATKTSSIGDPAFGPTRDLSRAPRVSVEGWASLASLGTAFDPHLLGWDLAAALHAKARGSREVREDVTLAAAGVFGTTIHEILSSFVERCPERSRAIVRAAVKEWVPEEFAIK